MFGKNPVRGPDNYQPGVYRVQSIFYTIQGEGPYAGTPAVFIRLAGCNLRCAFCDTDFESGWANVMSAEAIHAIVEDLAKVVCDLVVITGGEPFLQELSPLLKVLVGGGYDVQIETAGTLWQKEVEEFIKPIQYQAKTSIVVSPKTPKLHPGIIKNAMAYKYLVTWRDRESVDGLPIRLSQASAQSLNGVPLTVIGCSVALPPVGALIFLQPMEVQDPEETKSNVSTAAFLSMKFGHLLSLQLHKILGLE